MNVPWRAWLLCVLVGGCAAGTGAPCRADQDCPGGLCLRDGFPEGYCSRSCETAGCGAGEGCRAVAERPVCLARCGAGGACRAGYQCLDGLCQGPCRSDGDCGVSRSCQGGVCVARSGNQPGADCSRDDECASGYCAAGVCAQLCERDGDCPGEMTCALDRGASSLRAVCTDRRGGGGPLAGCNGDGNCDRGSCLMGVCLLLCQTPQDCDGDPQVRSCSGVPAPLRGVPASQWPELRTCLPRNQTFSSLVRTPLLVPRTARSVLLFTTTEDCDLGNVAGLGSLQDPDGSQLYRLPADQTIYYNNIIRSAPDLGCSSTLLTTSPQRAPVRFGAYAFQAVAQTQAGASVRADVRAFYKLLDAPQATGRVPLRFHITDMSGLPAGCAYRTLNAASAPEKLQALTRRLKEVFAQSTAKLTLDPITFVDSQAPTSVTVNDRTSLGGVLRAASRDTAGGLDLVLVRSISPSQVLGIAGGIPGAPGLPETPRTGAAVSMTTLCLAQAIRDQENFALVIAHELGHTMGLSHNREMDGQGDPLGDGPGTSASFQQGRDNLMFWDASTHGALLTSEQGQVLRSMPQVMP